MIGEARDRALRRAKEVGREGYRKARERAQGLAEQTKQHLSEGNGEAQSATPERAQKAGKGAARDYRNPEDARGAVERAAAERRSSEKSPTSKTPRA
jgi:hypothetical protein